MEGPFDPKSPGGPGGGYIDGGVGWYRKHFARPAGAHVAVQFDGVYMNADVWLNGRHLGKHPYGYTSFEFDLTPALKDGDNILAVRTEVAQPCSRFYSGGGIYRHVWLPDGHAPAAGQLPVPQQDALRAVQTVRSRAAEWGVDPQRVGVMGFSAGGHVAATADTLFDQAGILAGQAGNDAISRRSARPDFAVLVYPVITMEAAKTHPGSRKNLIGADADAEMTALFSVEQHVTPQTPPLFIVQAEDDKTVPPRQLTDDGHGRRPATCPVQAGHAPCRRPRFRPRKIGPRDSPMVRRHARVDAGAAPDRLAPVAVRVRRVATLMPAGKQIVFARRENEKADRMKREGGTLFGEADRRCGRA